MKKLQCNKSTSGDQELTKLLTERLGVSINRDLTQTRDFDSTGIDGWMLEVRRQEALNIAPWWRQTLFKAAQLGAKPVLAYRQSRQPWHFIIRLSDVCHNSTGDHPAQLDLEGFCQLVRAQQSNAGQCFTVNADPNQLQQIRGLCTRLGVTTNIPQPEYTDASF